MRKDTGNLQVTQELHTRRQIVPAGSNRHACYEDIMRAITSLQSGRRCRILALVHCAQGLEEWLDARIDGHITGISHSVSSIQIDLGAMIVISPEMQRLRSRSRVVAQGQKPSALAGVRLRPERIKQGLRARLRVHVTGIEDPLRAPLQYPVSAFNAVELDDVR